MWLEEFVWLWGPVVGGVGLWGVWSFLSLKAEVKTLQQRIARLENQNGKPHGKIHKAA